MAPSQLSSLISPVPCLLFTLQLGGLSSGSSFCQSCLSTQDQCTGCVLHWEGLLCFLHFYSASSFLSQAFSSLPILISAPSYSPLLTLQLSFVELTTVVILGYCRAFPMYCEFLRLGNLFVFTMVIRQQHAWYIVGTQMFTE